MSLKLPTPPTLCHHVGYVVFSGTHEKVGRSRAPSIVAAMADVVPRRDRPDKSRIDESMNAPYFVLDIDFAVAARLRRTGPDQAIILDDEPRENTNQRIGSLWGPRDNQPFDRSVGSPSLVVCAAPSPCVKRSTTSCNSAGPRHVAHAYLS